MIGPITEMIDPAGAVNEAPIAPQEGPRRRNDPRDASREVVVAPLYGPACIHEVIGKPLMRATFRHSEALATLEARCRTVIGSLRADAAHDVAHVERVVANARALAAAEEARLEIVLPAAWLHDCVVVPKDSPERANSSRLAATEAVRLLEGWDYPADLLPEIAHAIEAHSFSAGIAPRTAEARVLQDADRLDALGAVGLARCLMLGGALGRPLYVGDDPFCTHRAPDDRRATVDHLYSKLFTLAATMQTASGRAEAERRTAFLRQFVDELGRELAVPSASGGSQPLRSAECQRPDRVSDQFP